MGGRPCIRDLRVTVGTIVGCWRRATTWTQCWPRTRTLNATTSARRWLTPRGAARSRKSRSVRVEAPDRASGYETVPVSARIPQNPVFIGLDQNPNGSEKFRKRLAGAETAGSTAGRVEPLTAGSQTAATARTAGSTQRVKTAPHPHGPLLRRERHDPILRGTALDPGPPASLCEAAPEASRRSSTIHRRGPPSPLPSSTPPAATEASAPPGQPWSPPRDARGSCSTIPAARAGVARRRPSRGDVDPR